MKAELQEGNRKRWEEIREQVPLLREVRELRYAVHPVLPPHLLEVEKGAKELPCPECGEKRKGNPPEYDCGCDRGYECCDFDSALRVPCETCGYHGLVLVAPEGTPWEYVEALNQDKKRGTPCDGEGRWPKQRFLLEGYLCCEMGAQ